jgi:hypothetical protein
MNNATQSTINIIVTLFILFRMSKCQRNKYFIGTCGSQGPKAENKGLQQDLSKLMAARDAQDSRLQSVKPDEPKGTAIVEFKGSNDKKSDIDLILAGDF